MSRTPATRCKSFYGKKVGQNGAQGKAIRVLSQKTSVNNSYRRGVRLDERPENFTLTPAADGDSSGSENEFSQEDDYNFDETPTAGKSHYQDPLSSPYPRTPLSSHPNKHTNTIQDGASTSSQFQFPQSPLVSSSSTSQIVTMLQQQQSVLQKVLDGQKNLEERQNTIEAQLLDMQANIERSSSLCSSSESGSDGKRKRTVTRALSKKVYSVHNASDLQFKPNEPSVSDHNKKVQAFIIGEIVSQPDSKVTEDVAKMAVKRCYENLRRTHLEQQENKAEFVENQSKKRKYRSRRERKFTRRSSVVTKTEMENYWQFLSLAYVTEESDDPENPNGIIEHKLTWRSSKLDEFMEVLDERLQTKQQHQTIGLVAKKVRTVGQPSDSLPPPGAPTWAVKKMDTQNANTQSELEQEH